MAETAPGGMCGDARTYRLIGAAMEVHRVLGPGLLEAVYQEALELELGLIGVPCVPKPRVSVLYKGRELKAFYRPDFIAFGGIVVEIKAQSALGRVDEAQILNSLKCSGMTLGLLINFGESSLTWRRFAN